MKKALLLFYLLLFSALVHGQFQQPIYFSTGVTHESENKGGDLEFQRFLKYHLVYPPYSLSQRVEGTVVIHYECSASGQITKYKIVNRVAPDIDAEAERLFRLLLWTPAMQKDKAVDYDNSISFPFHVSKYKKVFKQRDKADPNLGKLPVDSSEMIYTKVDQLPIYVRGKTAYEKYVREELSYPLEAAAKSLEGTVMINFVVETNGFVSNMSVTKSVAGGCDQEALRILGPTKWQPAQKNGKLVRCMVSYPITFKLATDLRDNTMGVQQSGASGN